MAEQISLQSGVSLARKEDFNALIELQMLCFGDSTESAATFLQLRYQPDTCYIWEEEGSVLAMAYALPLTIQLAHSQISAAYFYAVATHPKAQGRGISTRLLEEAWHQLMQKGVQAALLVPATQELFGFYQKRGYQPVFSILEGSGDTLPCVRLPLPDLRPIEAEKYLQLRRSCLKGSIYADWELCHIHYQQELAVSSGGGLFAVEQHGQAVGCAAVELTEDTAYVKELLAPQPVLGLAVAALRQRFMPRSLHLRLWAKEDMRPALGENILNPRPFAMARAQNSELLLTMADGYFNLPLD